MQDSSAYLEILFVSSQIRKTDNLGRLVRDTFPRRLLFRMILRYDHLPVRLEPEYLVAGRGGSTGLDFVLVSEERDAGFAAAVVETTSGEYSQQRGFASVLVRRRSCRSREKVVVGCEAERGRSQYAGISGCGGRKWRTHDVANDSYPALDQIFCRLGLSPHHELEGLVPPSAVRILVVDRTRRRSQLDPVVRLVLSVCIEWVVQNRDLAVYGGECLAQSRKNRVDFALVQDGDGRVDSLLRVRTFQDRGDSFLRERVRANLSDSGSRIVSA